MSTPATRIMLSRRSFTGLESTLSVPVSLVRLGSCSGTSTVQFSTLVDKTLALDRAAGDKFENIKSRTVTFLPGETVQVVSVKLLDNDRWEATKFFRVMIDQPAGAGLGDITSASVSIADEDDYPGGETLFGWAMMRGFIREQIKERKEKFWKTAFALSYKGIFTVLDSIILKLALDNALEKKNSKDGCEMLSGSEAVANEDPASKRDLALILAGIYIVLFAFSHYCDVKQQDFRGRSGAYHRRREDQGAWHEHSGAAAYHSCCLLQAHENGFATHLCLDT